MIWTTFSILLKGHSTSHRREEDQCQKGAGMHLSHDAESMQDEEATHLVPPDQLSDESLISAIAGGAVWAMEPLYQRYSRMLYSLAYHMVTDHHLAQDLTQEAFLSAWRRAPT